MTYQELLEEFDRRRSNQRIDNMGDVQITLADVEWAIQSLLEKLRDGDKS